MSNAVHSLLERRQIFTDCVHLLTLHEPGNELHLLPEVTVPGGSVDYFLMSVCKEKVIDFVGIELQTLDTTGSLWSERTSLIRAKGLPVDELNTIAQDILDKSDEISNDDKNKLLVFLHDTRAQYYANLGERDKAVDAISRADAYAMKQGNSNDKRHFYIHAYVFMQFATDDKYREALEFLDKAIAIDNYYYPAIFLKLNIEAMLLESNLGDKLAELQKLWTEHIESSGDTALIADYYQALGIFYRQHEFYDEAIKALEESEKNETSIVNKISMAIAYYSWAVKNCPKDSYLQRPDIDYSKMIPSIEIMKGLLSNPKKLNPHFIKMLVPYYASASHFCGLDSALIDMQDYVHYDEADYELFRRIQIEKSFVNDIDEENIARLTQEDQVLMSMQKTALDGDVERAIELLEESVNNAKTVDVKRLYQPLLGFYLRTGKIDRYFVCIEKMKQIGICDVHYDWHRILILEKQGNVEDAQLAIERCLANPIDTVIVFGIRDFMIRNKLFADLNSFYVKIHELVHSKSLLFDGLDDFYGLAMQFLIDENYSDAVRIFDELPRGYISNETYHRIAVMVYWKTNNHKALVPSFKALFDMKQDAHYKLLEAQSLKSLCKIDLAKSATEEALNIRNLSDHDRSTLFVFIKLLSDKGGDYVTLVDDYKFEHIYPQDIEIVKQKILSHVS